MFKPAETKTRPPKQQVLQRVLDLTRGVLGYTAAKRPRCRTKVSIRQVDMGHVNWDPTPSPTAWDCNRTAEKRPGVVGEGGVNVGN